MYAVIVENDGKLEWYGVYEDKDIAKNRAKELNGKVVVLYHPFQKGQDTGDQYGREM